MNFSKFFYYVISGLTTLIPDFLHRYIGKYHLTSLSQKINDNSIRKRVNYYNRREERFSTYEATATRVNDFKKTGGTTYYFDLFKVVKCFPKHYKFYYLNGDIRYIPEQPTFLKSRPISNENHNAVLLKLNEIRHFNFLKDKMSFSNKKNMAVWRGLGEKPHRKIVIEQYYNHPMCNIGRTKPIEGSPLEKPFMSVEEQLNYKFILAIEGNDVASNLKWVMSSNSLAVMSKPKYETWFMEGLLQPGVHYVEVKDDYSDLIEKMEYYIAHPEEAQKIIDNAHRWVDQFRDKKRERLISLLVAKKYFELCQPE